MRERVAERSVFDPVEEGTEEYGGGLLSLRSGQGPRPGNVQIISLPPACPRPLVLYEFPSLLQPRARVTSFCI